MSFGGFRSALVAFLAAAAVLVVLMFALALGLAAAQERTAEALRAGAPAVKRWGGRILVLLGIWFVILGVFADQFAGVFSVWPAQRLFGNPPRDAARMDDLLSATFNALLEETAERAGGILGGADARYSARRRPGAA